MATALKIYTTDENNNAMTKTVSNANPEASDYVLKNFSQKLVSLSDSTFRRVERVNTKDITNATNASTDTGIPPITINSTTDYFSTDSDTYQAAVSSLTGNSLGIHQTTRGYTTYQLFADLGKMASYKNWEEFAKYLSSMSNGVVANEFKQISEITGKNHQLIFSNFGIDIIRIRFVQPTSTSSFVNGIWTNIIQPSESAPYTITFGEDGSNTVLTIERKE